MTFAIKGGGASFNFCLFKNHLKSPLTAKTHFAHSLSFILYI